VCRASITGLLLLLVACSSPRVSLGNEHDASNVDARVDATDADGSTHADAEPPDGAAVDAGIDAGACATAAQWCAQEPCCSGLACVAPGQNGFTVCENAGGAAVGAPCKADSDCAFRCLLDPRFPGGYCTLPIAECAAGGSPDAGDFNCPSGSVCLNGTPLAGLNAPDLCLKFCQVDGDCRSAEGYHCCPFRRGNVCWPPGGCP
jgi:hypothetical protein